MNAASPRYLIFSVDAESDAPEWKDHYHSNLRFNNCAGISLLRQITDEYGIRPTFLVTHAMADQTAFIDTVEPMLKDNRCEVGAHFHPGDTPPFVNYISSDNVLRVSDDVLNEKFEALQNQISSRFGRPTSFRCGAWTIDSRIIRLLLSYGYEADSSVTPSISWRLIGRPDYLHAPSNAYFMDSGGPSRRGETPLLEIPVTIWTPIDSSGPMGFINGTLFSMPLESRTAFFIQCIKIFHHNKPQWLRPAFSSLGDMIYTAGSIYDEIEYIHVMCHSNELTLGTSPYSNTKEKLDIILTRLKLFFSYARERGYIPVTLSEYARLYNARLAALTGGGAPTGARPALVTQATRRRLSHAPAREAASRRAGFLKAGFTIAVFAVILLKVNLAQFWSKALAINVTMLAVAMGLTMLTHCLNAWKVTLILPRRTLTLGTMMNINFMSTFFNNLFPTRFGGDFARVIYIGKALSSKEVGVYAVLFDRLTGFLIQTIVVLTSCALSPYVAHSGGMRRWCIAAVIALFMGAHGALALISRTVRAKKKFGFPLTFLNTVFGRADMRIFFEGLFENKWKHVFIHLTGYVFQSFVILTVIILTHAMGGSISFFEAALVLYIGTIACFLPLSIGGWGVLEGVFTYFYTILHAEPGIGLAVSLGLRITSILPSFIGGLVFLKRNKETL